MPDTSRPGRRASVAPPRIDPLTLTGLDPGEPGDLVRAADLESARYDDLRLPLLDLGDARADRVLLAGLRADETDLRGTRLSEVVLDHVDLPVVRTTRGQWRDVTVTGRLGSVEAYDARWSSVHFVGCKLGYLNLRGAELTDVAFTDCVIEELDLLHTTVRRVGFRQSRTGHLAVRESRLHDFDLRGTTLESIEGVLELRGTTVGREQLDLLAPLLADGLGLDVRD
ncbi:hypothetical protein [Nocardioides sp. SYSU DS0663]|uniref:hypothetical protein n=1 Tax=Nocardioides sp. SYSU DS0663 TaxID=3416445 RepID=UPI003F4BA37E